MHHKRISVSILLGLFLTGVVIAADTQKAEQRKLLADHQTVAQLDKIAFHKCMGRTSRCPDRCGASGDYASFKILTYISYTKADQYGDPQATTFTFQLEDNNHTPKCPPEILEIVKTLAPNDYVKLNWHHDYVTRNGASSPERPIVLLEKITKEEAEKLIKASESKQSTDKP